MAVANRYDNLRGLDLRTSDLLYAEQFSTDLQNVELSKDKQNIIKRKGYTQQTTSFGGNGLFNYKTDSELIGLGSDVKEFNSGTPNTVTNSGNITLDTTNLASSVQYLDNLYMANGINDPLKYDGQSWYRAGVPNAFRRNLAGVTTIGGSGANPKDFAYRVGFAYYDRNGLVTSGQISPDDAVNGIYDSLELTDANTSVTVNFIPPQEDFATTTSSDKWVQNNLYTKVGGTPGPYVMAPDNKVYELAATHTSTTGGTEIDDFTTDLVAGNWELAAENVVNYNVRGAITTALASNTNTLTVAAGHTVEVGDYIWINSGATLRAANAARLANGDPLIQFENLREVTGVTATTITFAGDPEYVFIDTAVPVSVGMVARIYQKNVTDSGSWELMREVAVDHTEVVNFVTFTKTDQALGDDTEPTQDRGLPPKGRYLEIFQGKMIIAGNSDDPDTIFFSNEEGPESFSVFNNLIIGTGEDGDITGLKVLEDILFVFKTKAIYYVSGNLGQGNIRVDRIFGDGIGCTSHASIREVDGVIYFMSRTGIHAIQGQQRPLNLSLAIESLFTLDTTGLDLSQAIGINHHVEDKYMVFVPATADNDDRIFVYDYFYESWFIWTNMHMDGGAVVFNDELYWSEASGATNQKQTPAFNDNGVAIDSFWRSMWFHFGDPAAPKKLNDIRVYALTGENYTLTIQSEKDWVSGSFETNETITFDATTRFDKKNLVSRKPYSYRISFSNNTLDEGLEVTGFDLEAQFPMGGRVKKG